MRIKIEFQGPGFVAVPNHVVALVGNGLEAVDLAALVVLAALPVGSDWSAAWVQKRLGVGRDAWQAISRRLRAVGAVWDEVQTGEDGRHRGRCLSVRWPDAPDGAKRARRRPDGGGAPGWKHRKPGKPNAGKSGMGMPEKPNAGKPGIRSAEVIEIVGETSVEMTQNPPCPKTKTGEAVAAPPGLAATASPCPVLQAEGERVERSGEEKARAAAIFDELLTQLRGKVAAEPRSLRMVRPSQDA